MSMNTAIMIFPLLAFGIFWSYHFGEAVLLMAMPMLIFLPLVVLLSRRLCKKEAIAYVIVQYLFMPLLFLLTILNPHLGLELILMVPLVFIVNMTIGCVYFRFAKRKRWFTKTAVVVLTLAVAYFVFPPVFVATPVITSGEFPFRIVYVQNGEYHVIEDTVIAEFSSISHGQRNWSTQRASGNMRRMDILNLRDEISPFRHREALSIDIFFAIPSGAYFMGERSARNWGPSITVHETFAMTSGGSHMPGRIEISKEQLERYFGIEIVEWNFPEPKNNRFRFFSSN